jgi:hypothetical protein
MRRGEAPMMAERELGPVDEQPEVRQAIASVQAAEATCRRAGEALVQARIDAGRAYTETRASLPTRAWSAVQGWQARLDLPELERAFACVFRPS